MKNILVPTDFSYCAKGAVEAGLSLAEQYGAKLHLFHGLPIPKNRTEGSQTEKAEVKQLIHNAELLFAEWKTIAAQRKVNLQTHLSGGKLVDAVEEIRKKFQIDFIIMGSHGASGKNEYFIGSNTQKVVRSVHCPVLIIKEPMMSYRFQKVVFASNFDPKEKRAFQYFLDFVKAFEPEIHLVEINTSSFFGQPYILAKELMDDFAEMAKPLDCKTHFYRDFNVDAGVRKFSQEIGAQLIGISNQIRHPLKRMFSGSNVEALVNHARVPVLSIDFPKSNSKSHEIQKDSVSHGLFSMGK